MLPASLHIVTKDTGPFYMYRAGYRQLKPYTEVLDLVFMQGTISSGYGNPDHGSSGNGKAFRISTWNEATSGAISRCIAKAIDTFSSSIQEKAQLGTDLAEYHQSLEMIGSAVQKVGKIVQAVRKKDIPGLFKALDPRGHPPKGKKIVFGKSFADNFLAVHFGWVPLFQDIHDAAQAISSPIKSDKARGHARDRFDYDSGLFQNGVITSRENWRAVISVKVGANVACTNPALHLASNLGLTNPLSVAWEIIPFSFVVDWFSNVGQFIGQLDQFAGLSISHGYCTVSVKASGESLLANVFWTPPSQPYTWEAVTIERTPGIPSVPLVLKPLKLPSVVRALTAVSLVIQQLSK